MRRLRVYFSRWQNWLGLLLVVIFVTVAFTAPLLSPDDPDNPGPEKRVGRSSVFEPKPPSQAAPLGTLPSQISVYHALIWGTRSAVVFGVVVALISAIIGTLMGAVGAYSGGIVNGLLMRISDAFLSFPVIAGVVLVQQVVTLTLFNAGVMFTTYGIFMIPDSSGSIILPEEIPPLLLFLHKLDPVLIAFILFSWMPYARMMNSVVLRIKHTEYFEAARTAGARPSRLIFRHLIPNAITPVVVMTARDVGSMVLLQTTFMFIGLGGNSPWGMILINGRDWILNPGGIFTYWWVFVPATLALMLFGIGWNLLGDGLNDALNPRSL